MSFDVGKVQTALYRAHTETWLHHKLLEALIDAGVVKYVTVFAPFSNTYYGANGESFVGFTPDALKGDWKAADHFDQGKAQIALQRRLKDETDLPTFIREMAEAGAHTYEMDAKTKQGIYYGKDHKDFLKETV